MKISRPGSMQARARELCALAGLDPDSRIELDGQRSMPAWCQFRDAAEQDLLETARELSERTEQHENAPLHVVGDHEQGTLTQMRNCMRVGSVIGAALCADAHVGYAQPVGGVVAYDGQISISGVGFDIACGNMAVRLDVRLAELQHDARTLADDIQRTISFGVGRSNDERVEHELFDDDAAWVAADMVTYRQRARAQLGTVGSGNHYVDLFSDAEGYVWIGVHFGSRGLGHTSATRYLELAGGKEGMNVPPAVVRVTGEIGTRYLAAMELAGRYAYAGREWVVERVRQIIGGQVTDTVHNHHNYAWLENGAWVVRKGATPAFPGQRGFVGGSMGDNAVIIEGVDSAQSQALLRSTVHGAGRVMGRRAAMRQLTREAMHEWLESKRVTLAGGDLDESPMAYRRLPDVLAHHTESIRVLHTLQPFVVVMAGSDTYDPFKD